MRQNKTTWFHIGGSGLDRTDDLKKICGSGLDRIQNCTAVKSSPWRHKILCTSTIAPKSELAVQGQNRSANETSWVRFARVWRVFKKHRKDAVVRRKGLIITLLFIHCTPSLEQQQNSSNCLSNNCSTSGWKQLTFHAWYVPDGSVW